MFYHVLLDCSMVSIDFAMVLNCFCSWRIIFPMVFNDFSVVPIDLSMIPIDLSMIVHHGLNHFSSLGCSQSLLKLE